MSFKKCFINNELDSIEGNECGLHKVFINETENTYDDVSMT